MWTVKWTFYLFIIIIILIWSFPTKSILYANLEKNPKKLAMPVDQLSITLILWVLNWLHLDYLKIQ